MSGYWFDGLAACQYDDDWWDDYDRGNAEPDCMDAYHRAFEEAD